MEKLDLIRAEKVEEWDAIHHNGFNTARPHDDKNRKEERTKERKENAVDASPMSEVSQNSRDKLINWWWIGLIFLIPPPLFLPLFLPSPFPLSQRRQSHCISIWLHFFGYPHWVQKNPRRASMTSSPSTLPNLPFPLRKFYRKIRPLLCICAIFERRQTNDKKSRGVVSRKTAFIYWGLEMYSAGLLHWVNSNRVNLLDNISLIWKANQAKCSTTFLLQRSRLTFSFIGISFCWFSELTRPIYPIFIGRHSPMIYITRTFLMQAIVFDQLDRFIWAAYPMFMKNIINYDEHGMKPSRLDDSFAKFQKPST